MLAIDLNISDGQGSESTTTIYVATTVADMTFRQWVDFNLLCEAWPDWLKEFAELSKEKQLETRQGWDNLHQAEYYHQLAKVVECFTTPKGSLAEVLGLQLFHEGRADTNSIELLSSKIFSALTTYKPNQARSGFVHKGRHFVVPETEIVKIGEMQQVTRMASSKAGEVIEALQRSHILGARDDKGAQVMPDAKYHTDIAMIASVCREKLPGGQLETVPLGIKEFSGFVNDRIDFLADLPADIALDIGFFLTNSLRTYVATAMLDWRSKNRNQRRQSKGQRKGLNKSQRTRKGGKRGAGILRFFKSRKGGSSK